MVGLKLVTDYSLPASGILSLARVKEHLRVSGTAEDDVLTGYLWAAIRYAEEFTGYSLLSATYKQTLNRFPGGSDKPIRLLRSPATSLTSLTYVDVAGATQSATVADYTLSSDAEPSLLTPDFGLLWPSNVATRPAVITVTYAAGFASADAIPKYLVQAVYLLVGHWYENRESVVVGMTANKVPLAVDALLDLCKVVELDYEPQEGYSC